MRKRWTAQTEVTDTLLKFREKRKWQIALRRYVLDGNPCSFYAPYFGLDIATYRKWIEAQFTEGLTWDNFSSTWQFDHIVPLSYFDFTQDQDLLLCWNFTNIRVERIDDQKDKEHHIDVLAAKSYFETLYTNTGIALCKDMVERINQVEAAQLANSKPLEAFLLENKEHIQALSSFGIHEFTSLNEGVSVAEIKAEQELLKKFGGQ
ncbi:MAG: hypothetical protein P0Y53_05185 [Candidatus Pseudobacter hemicellulosilyticus]|uniref:HNH endonuclease n=1 Tax=Candidatus Pseudobacter hemicellulosilyticus TaxID=3121375 RepID=A0AAJ6BGN1_9BACT|nr:MAG: hypothetical protein P0Y53_05185 [Pseudobacter sp.]